MKIETDEWVTLADACKTGGFSQPTGYRLAKSLGVIQVIFGVKVLKKSDIKTMKENRRRLGNPDWIKSYEAASEAAYKAIESRERRKKAATT